MARIGLWMHKKYCLHDEGVTCGNVCRYVGAIRKVKNITIQRVVEIIKLDMKKYVQLLFDRSLIETQFFAKSDLEHNGLKSRFCAQRL